MSNHPFGDEITCPFCTDTIYFSIKSLCRHVEKEHIMKECFNQKKVKKFDFDDLDLPDGSSSNYISSQEMNSPVNSNGTAFIQKGRLS